MGFLIFAQESLALSVAATRLDATLGSLEGLLGCLVIHIVVGNLLWFSCVTEVEVRRFVDLIISNVLVDFIVDNFFCLELAIFVEESLPQL